MHVVLMIVVAILVFGLVIFIHELGHFLTAKKAGVKVNEFSLGMGPALFRRKRGETYYALRLFPIGGYVSMEGEDEHSDDKRGFQNAPIYKRVLIIIAGAVMNLLLGFLVLVILISAGGDVASKTVSQVRSETSGLQPGDEFIKINGRRCYIIDDLAYEFARTQNGTFDFVIKRDGEKIELNSVSFDKRTAYDETTGEPVMNEATGEPYEYLDVGFAVLPVDKNPLTVTKQAFLNTLSYARVIYLTLFDLVMGRVPINQLAGPVGIISELGKAIRIGWQPVLNMLALLSINLGVLNMLPLPALDGGKVALLAVEAVRGKPLDMKYEVAITLVGLVLLFGLIILVSFNDIRRLIL